MIARGVSLGPDDGLPSVCVLKPEWIRSVERAYLGPLIAQLSHVRLPEVRDALSQVLGLDGLLDKRGLLHVEADDALAQDSPALSACYEGAVTQRVGLGPMKGRPVIKLGVPLATYLGSARERVQRGGILCANIDGLDLHGGVAFSATQRERLEELGALLRAAGDLPAIASDVPVAWPEGTVLAFEIAGDLSGGIDGATLVGLLPRVHPILHRAPV